MNALTQEKLVGLSRLDSTLREIEQQIAAGPGRLERLTRRRARLEETVGRVQEELETVLAERRGHEKEAEAIEGKIATFETQLMAIKSNADYQAMLRQIDEARASRSEFESRALECMVREEELGERVKTEKQRLAREVEAVEAERRVVESELAEIRARRARLREERDGLAAALIPELRERYERVRRRKQGVGIVPVVKRACGGCFNALPPQRVNEARLGDSLVVCEGCGRIVIWDGEQSDA